jgi:hypothetical protein
MSDPAVLFVRPKAISARDKKTLSSSGVIVVEIDDPTAVKFVRANAEITSTEMLRSALMAIAETGYEETKKLFFDKVAKAIVSRSQ